MRAKQDLAQIPMLSKDNYELKIAELNAQVPYHELVKQVKEGGKAHQLFHSPYTHPRFDFDLTFRIKAGDKYKCHKVPILVFLKDYGFTKNLEHFEYFKELLDIHKRYKLPRRTFQALNQVISEYAYKNSLIDPVIQKNLE